MASFIVIANGDIRDLAWHRERIKECSNIICADGGANHAYELGLTPLLVIGDLDSARPEILAEFRARGCAIRSYPRDKDWTDTQLALLAAKERGATEILLLGGIGHRLDHTLANLMLLVWAREQGIPLTIANEENQVWLVEESLDLQGQAGDQVSLLPLTPVVSGVKTTGLKYGLDDGSFTQSNPYGVSNVMLGERARVEVGSGRLLLMKVRDRAEQGPA